MDLSRSKRLSSKGRSSGCVGLDRGVALFATPAERGFLTLDCGRTTPLFLHASLAPWPVAALNAEDDSGPGPAGARAGHFSKRLLEFADIRGFVQHAIDLGRQVLPFAQCAPA